MANSSIFAAFERMWQHIVAALNNKANAEHTHHILDIGGGATKTLCWTNSAPESTYGANVMFIDALDLRDYDAIEVVFCNSNSSIDNHDESMASLVGLSFDTTGEIPIMNDSTRLLLHSVYYYYNADIHHENASPLGMCSRRCVIDSTNNTITFNHGYYKDYSNTQNAVIDDYSCIPVRIYAIKRNA